MKDIIWFDIETVAETNEYLTYPKKNYRDKKYLSKPEMHNETTEQSYYNKSGLYAEFSKVVCISTKTDGKVQSFVGEEKEILKNFFALLDSKPGYCLGGYNINSFDIPYVWKRAVINGIKPQALIDVGDTKPWEKTSVDVMNIWKQGSFACSLDLLCYTLFKNTPKDEGDGGAVFDRYYYGKIEDIRIYCEKDVNYTEQVYKYLDDPVGYKIRLNDLEKKKAELADKISITTEVLQDAVKTIEEKKVNQDQEGINEVEKILEKPAKVTTQADIDGLPF